MIAIERNDSWVLDFGDAPETDELYEKWLLEVAGGAAYFDRWGVNNADTIFDDATYQSRTSCPARSCSAYGRTGHRARRGRGRSGEVSISAFGRRTLRFADPGF